MNARRVVQLMPWMVRLSMDGSLKAAVALLALFWIPFVAISLWGAQIPFVQIHLYSTLPAFIGMQMWRLNRRRHWNFLVSLPFTSRQLVTAALLTDAVVAIILTLSFRFANVQSYATELLGLWAVFMISGFWSHRLWLVLFSGTGGASLAYLHFTVEQHQPQLLVLTATAAVMVTIAEVWLRSRTATSAAKPKAGTTNVEAQAAIRLPFSAWRRTQLGMMLMSDKLLIAWAPFCLISWYADGFSRAVLVPNILIVSTLLIAVSTAAFVNGKAGEFFAVRPVPRARLALTYLAIALVFIVTPGITRVLTVSTTAATSRRLEYVSFNRGGCSHAAAECEQKFASSINYYSGGPAFAFAIDLVPGQRSGKAVFHPGPQTTAAFRRAMIRGGVSIALQLAATFIMGILIAFYSNLINVRGARRWDSWFIAALILSGAGIAGEVFARNALPFPGLALMTAFTLAATLIASRLMYRRFALP